MAEAWMSLRLWWEGLDRWLGMALRVGDEGLRQGEFPPPFAYQFSSAVDFTCSFVRGHDLQPIADQDEGCPVVGVAEGGTAHLALAATDGDE